MREYRSELRKSFSKGLSEISATPGIVLRELGRATPLVGKTLTSGLEEDKRKKIFQSITEVETILANGLYGQGDQSQSHRQQTTSVALLLDETELTMKTIYTTYNDKFGDLITQIKAVPVPESKLYPPSASIDEILLRDCKITNDDDRIIVSEAARLMFTQDKWTAIVTNDHVDLLSNKDSVRKHCLVSICDPVYVFEEMKERVESGLSPIETAKQMSFDFRSLVRVPVDQTRVV